MTPQSCAELLTILGPASPNLELGGTSTNLRQLLAVSLGTLPPQHQSVLRARYVPDDGERLPLVRWLMVDASGWIPPGPKGYIRRLANMVLAVHLEPLRCGTCEGRRVVWRMEGDANTQHGCVVCGGRGTVSPELDELCDALECTERDWGAVHGQRYRRMLRTVRAWDSGGLYMLAEVLG